MTAATDIVDYFPVLDALLLRDFDRRSVDSFDRGIVPGSGDPIIAARDALERLLENLREQQQRGAYGGTACERASDRQRRSEIARDHCGLIVIARCEPGAAGNADLCSRATEQEIAGKRVAVAQLEVALHAVECEALLGQIAEIEREPPRQRRDAEQPEHASGAGLHRDELTVLGAHADGACSAIEHGAVEAA